MLVVVYYFCGGQDICQGLDQLYLITDSIPALLLIFQLNSWYDYDRLSQIDFNSEVNIRNSCWLYSVHIYNPWIICWSLSSNEEPGVEGGVQPEASFGSLSKINSKVRRLPLTLCSTSLTLLNVVHFITSGLVVVQFGINCPFWHIYDQAYTAW